jgi:hypothetical protein
MEGFVAQAEDYTRSSLVVLTVGVVTLLKVFGWEHGVHGEVKKPLSCRKSARQSIELMRKGSLL